MEKQKPIVELELFLIRHGQSQGNVGYDKADLTPQEQHDPILTDKGIKQAQLAGKHLSEIDFDRVFSSGLLRAVRTATEILKEQSEEGTFWYAVLQAIDSQSFLYMVFYFVMIIGFSYFYASIQFNPVEISNNLKRNGGFIPGFRPGKPTSDFIAKVLNKVTLFGAIYLAIVAIVPLLAGKILPVNVGIGGTSVIIVVGVALETVNALESQMLMRQYKGFLE